MIDETMLTDVVFDKNFFVISFLSIYIFYVNFLDNIRKQYSFFSLLQFSINFFITNLEI